MPSTTLISLVFSDTITAQIKVLQALDNPAAIWDKRQLTTILMQMRQGFTIIRLFRADISTVSMILQKAIKIRGRLANTTMYLATMARTERQDLEQEPVWIS